MQSPAHQNRLAGETSAYLLQHAGNPVDWYPWGEEALGLARRTGRPILLSVGYSACHWCHVMERECFEDAGIAALMNEHFVCIKVDREERPDVDQVYMKALQGMTGRGGWPMTMFLTPDGRPFYAGTYFPPEDRHGMPGFPRVLLGVSKTWEDQRGEVDGRADRVVAFLAEDGRGEDAGAALTDEALAEAVGSLASAMDGDYGGFGRAPKFPGTMALSLLLEVGDPHGDGEPERLAALSLDHMAAGGIRDHLGGGFHRYSVDRVWLVPHFEKMLYDQALMAGLYAEASARPGGQAYEAVAAEILDYVVREMTSAAGGFFASQDADSEGEEGRYFVWTPAEISEVLGPERGNLFCRVYGVTEDGNFEGCSILHRPVRGAGEPEDPGLEKELAACRTLLLERRRSRVAPATDRKVAADWNGLMISAMARAGVLLGRGDFVDAAERAFSCVRESLEDSGHLFHVAGSGGSRVPGFLDDYAFFGRAALDLFAARPTRAALELATMCAGRLLGDFQDTDGGGFYFADAAVAGDLPARTCDLHDGAVPAGNSVAAELLLRLWSLTGEERYRAAAQGVLDRFLAGALRVPYGGAHLLAVAARARKGLRTVAVLGEETARRRLAAAARRAADPRTTVIEVDGEALIPALEGKTAPAAGAVAYICDGLTCGLPMDDEGAMAAALSADRGLLLAPPATTEVST